MAETGSALGPWHVSIRQITGDPSHYYGYVFTNPRNVDRCCPIRHTSSRTARACATREAMRRNRPPPSL